jgi:tripartite-type tricarboxylate transporter receptor subunit TctC
VGNKPSIVRQARIFNFFIGDRMSRHFGLNALAIAAALTVGVAPGAPVSAQTANSFPRQPIRIVVPFAAGGTPDIVARLLAQYAGEGGRQFVVENITGAGGNIAMQTVAHAAPDGHTVLMCTVGCASNMFLMEKMGWDPNKDLAPVMMAGIVPNVLVVGPTVNSNSVRDFVELAKSKPGSLTMASSGIGSASHLAGEMFKAMAGVEIVHIPYRGSTAALPDIMAGRVDSMIVSLPEALSLIRSGSIRALGVSSEGRVDSLPDVPTLSEAGVPGYAVVAWSALFAPAATPPAAIEWLNREFNKALKEPAVQTRLAELGILAAGGAPDVAGAFLRAEMVAWGKLITSRGIKAQ